MNHHALHEVARPPRPDPERMSALLARYPEVSRDEAREILTFLQNGRYVDVGLLTSDRGLGQNLDAFLKDHWVHFHVRPGQGEVVVGGIVILLFVLWIIWAAFS
jgi:hypothetical protein